MHAIEPLRHVSAPTSWFVALDGAPFAETQTSSFKVPQLRFGDFNGNGRTDVFNVGPTTWRISDGATAGWLDLRPRLTTNVNQLVIADVDGNGVDDVVMTTPQFGPSGGVRYTTSFSSGGLGGWTAMVATPLEPAMLGRFVPDDSRAALLMWNGDYLVRAMHGDTALAAHSRQNMR